LDDNSHLIQNQKQLSDSEWKRIYDEFFSPGTPIHQLVFHPRWGFRDDAADILQEIQIASYKALPTFQGKSLAAFLWRIAQYRCISAYRKKKRRIPAVSLNSSGIAEYVSPRSFDTSVEKKIEMEELTEHIHRAVFSLNEKHRQVLRLKFFEEYSNKEIAQLLNIKEGTVSSRIYRALVKLEYSIQRMKKGINEAP
jgi:RNA polymerase sigma-70 factor (ECF subfamily)